MTFASGQNLVLAGGLQPLVIPSAASHSMSAKKMSSGETSVNTVDSIETVNESPTRCTTVVAALERLVDDPTAITCASGLLYEDNASCAKAVGGTADTSLWIPQHVEHRVILYTSTPSHREGIGSRDEEVRESRAKNEEPLSTISICVPLPESVSRSSCVSEPFHTTTSAGSIQPAWYRLKAVVPYGSGNVPQNVTLPTFHVPKFPDMTSMALLISPPSVVECGHDRRCPISWARSTCQSSGSPPLTPTKPSLLFCGYVVGQVPGDAVHVTPGLPKPVDPAVTNSAAADEPVA